MDKFQQKRYLKDKTILGKMSWVYVSRVATLTKNNDMQ